jgi:hypothetical protein
VWGRALGWVEGRITDTRIYITYKIDKQTVRQIDRKMREIKRKANVQESRKEYT